MDANKITELKQPRDDETWMQQTADSVEALKREVKDLKSDWPYARKRIGTVAIVAVTIALFTFAIALFTLRGASPAVIALQGQVNQALEAISLLQDNVGTMAGKVDDSIVAFDMAEIHQFNVFLDKMELGGDPVVKAQVAEIRKSLSGLLILIAEKGAGLALQAPVQETP